MNFLQRLTILGAWLLCACGETPDQKNTSKPAPAGAFPPTAFSPDENGELHLELGNGSILVPTLSIGSNPAEMEIRSLGPQSIVSFVPVWLSEKDDTENVEYALTLNWDGGTTQTSGGFSRVAPLEWNGDRLLALMQKAVQIPISADEGTSVSLKWTASPPPSGSLQILSPKVVGARAAERPPDMLIVCADALRLDHSLLGQGPELMPNLAALARESVVYDHAYVAATWTLPSMSSILTGMWPLAHGAGQRPETGKKPDVFAGKFPASMTTFPEVLRERGYFTVLIYSNAVVDVSGMYREGFDIPIQSVYQPAARLHEQLRAVLRAVPPQVPLLVVIHYLDIHHYKEWTYGHSLGALKSPYADPEAVINAYERAVKGFDESLPELRETWSGSRDFDSTVFVLFADHGEHLVDPGYRNLIEENGGNMLRLRLLPIFSHGSSMEDVLLRVPLLIRRPKSDVWQPRISDSPVSLVDLFPTLATEAGAPHDDLPLRGIPLQPLRQRATGDEADAGERLLFADYQLNGDQLSSVRRGRFKLVINLTKKSSTLLDMSKQIDERGEAGLMVENPEVATELQTAWDEYSRAAEALRGSHEQPVIEQDDKVIREMKKMGYL